MLPIDCCMFDLDGTLLRSDKTVSPRTVSALQKLSQSGRTIVLATSRNDICVKGLALRLGVNGPIISCNGALIRSLNGDPEIYSSPVPKQSARMVVDYCLQNQYSFTISIRGAMCVSTDSKKAQMFCDYNASMPPDCHIPLYIVAKLSDLPAEEILKVYIETLPTHSLDGLKAHLNTAGQLGCLSFVRSGGGIDVSKQSVSKGAALHIFADRFAIRPERIAAFGDDHNDISMLHAAGYSFAMGQAPGEVRRLASYTTLNNDADGVALAIETYLL